MSNTPYLCIDVFTINDGQRDTRIVPLREDIVDKCLEFGIEQVGRLGGFSRDARLLLTNRRNTSAGHF